jgi:hypothetical protein
MFGIVIATDNEISFNCIIKKKGKREEDENIVNVLALLPLRWEYGRK